MLTGPEKFRPGIPGFAEFADAQVVDLGFRWLNYLCKPQTQIKYYLLYRVKKRTNCRLDSKIRRSVGLMRRSLNSDQKRPNWENAVKSVYF